MATTTERARVVELCRNYLQQQLFSRRPSPLGASGVGFKVMAASVLTLVGAGPPSDGALCRAYLSGDVSALAVLIERHQGSVVAVARRYSHSADDARDLAQRALLQAVEAAARTLSRWSAGDEMPFRQWLLRIVINLGKNAVRDGTRRPSVDFDSVATESPDASAESRLIDRQAVTRLRAAVEALSPRQREVFSLRVDAELPFAEVASVLGITEGNAKVHFHHAMKHLRLALADGAERSSDEAV